MLQLVTHCYRSKWLWHFCSGIPASSTTFHVELPACRYHDIKDTKCAKNNGRRHRQKIWLSTGKSSDKQTPPPLNCIKKCGLKEAKLSGRVLTKRECRNGGADLGEAIFDCWVDKAQHDQPVYLSLQLSYSRRANESKNKVHSQYDVPCNHFLSGSVVDVWTWQKTECNWKHQ